MIDAMEKMNLADEAAQLTEFWSQRVIASGNGNLFKVAKGIGSTSWHTHEDQDEVFLVIEGHIVIQLRDRDVDLGPGDLFVVPRGTSARSRSFRAFRRRSDLDKPLPLLIRTSSQDAFGTPSPHYRTRRTSPSQAEPADQPPPGLRPITTDPGFTWSKQAAS